MICTDVQVYCRNGRRLLPDNENDIRMLLAEPENLMRLTCSSEIADLEAEFAPDGAAFIGVVNELTGEIHYFDNGSGSEESVELMINVCPAEKMMCYDKEQAADIILHFCNTGEVHPKYNWIKEEV